MGFSLYLNDWDVDTWAASIFTSGTTSCTVSMAGVKQTIEDVLVLLGVRLKDADHNNPLFTSCSDLKQYMSLEVLLEFIRTLFVDSRKKTFSTHTLPNQSLTVSKWYNSHTGI